MCVGVSVVVCVGVCGCVYVCVGVYIYVCVCVGVYIYVCVGVSVCSCVFERVCTCRGPVNNSLSRVPVHLPTIYGLQGVGEVHACSYEYFTTYIIFLVKN